MPAPRPATMQKFARDRFRAFGIVLPMDWQQPQGQVPTVHYRDAFKKSEREVEPEPEDCLFRSATRNKYHVRAATEVSRLIGDFIDHVCRALCMAWAKWQDEATLSNVSVAGPVASGGEVSGPYWEEHILEYGPKRRSSERRYMKAIAKAVASRWREYEETIKVPGLAWYPSFALASGPVSAQNVPSPVGALTQVTLPLTTPQILERMGVEHGDGGGNHYSQVFEAIGDSFHQCFQIWQKETLITGVEASGVAPPMGGPVASATGNMQPGGFK